MSLIKFAPDPLRILHVWADPPSVQPTASAVEAGSLALALAPLPGVRYDVQPACSRGDLVRRLNQVRPHVLHISGHGNPDGSVVLMHPDSGAPSPLDKRDLAMLLEGRRELELVVLTSCHGLVAAEALATAVNAVVGVIGSLQEPYPVVFAASLYHSMAHGRPAVHAVRSAIVDADERRPIDSPRFELRTFGAESQAPAVRSHVRSPIALPRRAILTSAWRGGGSPGR